MQHAQQVRHGIVVVIGVDAVRTRQLRPSAQRIPSTSLRTGSAEAELPGQRVGQRCEAIQRVVVVGIGRAIGGSQRFAVRRRVVGVAVLEIMSSIRLVEMRWSVHLER